MCIVPAARYLVQDDFVFAVTVQIRDRGIAGPVLADRLYWNFKVVAVPSQSRL
jgi:hypothetical protein